MLVQSAAIFSWVCMVLVLLLSASRVGAAGVQLVDWDSASPQSLGFDPGRLAEFQKHLADSNTTSLLVIRHGHVACEWYAPKFSRYTPHGTASLAKALVGGMSLMAATDMGRISADDLASRYIPAWKNDPARSAITIRQLATHTSGIEDAEEGEKKHEQLTGWKGDFWKREPDPFSISIYKAPVLFKPGTANAYSNPGMAALAYAITASLKGSDETNLRDLLRKHIMEPIGVPEKEWSIGYGKPSKVDGLTLYATWGGASYSPRAAAAVGQLLMRKGMWNGKAVLGQETVEKALTYAGMPVPARSPGEPAPGSGLAWYTNFDHVWKSVPKDAFAGAGAGQQVLMVAPSLELIVVRFGSELPHEKGLDYWGLIDHHLFQPLMASLVTGQHNAKAPYPPSPVITGIEWAPKQSIVRKAIGSDCWPMTWADDDNQYTAWGDGNGFEPQLKEKLSLGFSRVEGAADSFQGYNIRSPIEQKGNGPAGKKASGILMVDGKLYLLIRNAHNAQVACSSDHGQSWTWANWRFEQSIGCPTFLNYGRNYSGARDDYVYLYSADSDSAYDAADRMVLARVPKDRVMKRDAYEFFQKLDDRGRPVWTQSIDRRGAVFENQQACCRGGIVYDVGIRRYLWWQGIQSDGRFKGGFGIYDGPEPWGPWTTAYFTPAWDVGPGESASFPTKWMSPDGQTLYLVFSGQDSFGVRGATLRLARK